ncbi:hypothetical protein EN840_35680, partial [Mesorhizobium sp. M8A.F.Ca.ET.197.01.1.1]
MADQSWAMKGDYKAYQNYKAGNAPEQAPAASEPELLPPPKDTAFRARVAFVARAGEVEQIGAPG